LQCSATISLNCDASCSDIDVDEEAAKADEAEADVDDEDDEADEADEAGVEADAEDGTAVARAI